MAQDAVRASHTLFNTNDVDAPPEVSQLEKAVCRICGRSGAALYLQRCGDPTERPDAQAEHSITGDENYG
jgi:hypothetical protein